MVANRSKDTGPERAVRASLHARGYRYRVSYRPLPSVRRSADIVFTRQRVAIFIDGCFWHGCPDHFIAPKSNAEYWNAKITGNKTRDRDTDRRLEEAGWTVIRCWEHERVADVVARIESVNRPEFRSVLSFWRMELCQDRIRTSSVSARCGC